MSTRAGFTGSHCDKCESGFFGEECCPCPGMGDEESVSKCRKGQLNQQNVCSRVGKCSDGKAGSGTCACIDGFSGPACSVGSCAEGHYLRAASVPPLFECVKCETGKYCKKPGSLAQPDGRSDCDPGNYCAAGVTAPQPCAPGSFTKDPRVECEQCPPARFQDTKAGAECKACPAGKFQGSPGKCAGRGRERSPSTGHMVVAVSSPQPVVWRCLVLTPQAKDAQTHRQTDRRTTAHLLGVRVLRPSALCVLTFAALARSPPRSLSTGQERCEDCTECERGFETFKDCTATVNAECTPCAAGKFKGSKGSEACTACAAGKFQQKTGGW